ncbi:MAG: ABC transporter ATP-binding protein [Alphaproteobacteria bacterium]
MAALLELVGVERRYRAADGGFRLSIPSLSVEPGERIVLIGPSGSGKSTLLDLLAFLAAPDRAERFVLRADGMEHDVASCWAQGDLGRLTWLRARHLGYVMQTGGLLPYLSVGENILLSRRLLDMPVPGPAEELVAAVEIAELWRRRPAQLSIGQRQRVAVVRALAHRPLLILADEPTAALEGTLALKLVDVLVAMTERVGAALIMVTHEEAVAVRARGRTLRCRPQPDALPATSVLEG